MNLTPLRQFVNHSIVGYGVEALSYCSFPFSEKKSPEKKFVLFSSGRAGSTLLVKLLDNHSLIHCEGEILRRKMLNPYAYIERCSQITENSVFGFKLLSYQLQEIQTKEGQGRFLQNLVEDGFQIVYLERKNILRQALSVMYGYHRDQWHVKKGQSLDATKMKIDPVALRDWMDGIEALKAYEKKVIEVLPHLHIVYEEDLSIPEQQSITVETVTDFLELPNEKVKSSLKRVTPKNLSSFVENVDEVINFLGASRYHQYLESINNSIKTSG